MKILGIIVIINGIFSLIFRDKIISWQGPDRKGYFPLETRKRKLIIGGIVSIVAGIVILLKYW